MQWNAVGLRRGHIRDLDLLRTLFPPARLLLLCPRRWSFLFPSSPKVPGPGKSLLCPTPGLIGPPCASPHSSHISPHTASRRAKAGSSTCRAQRATEPGGPTSGHSTGGAGTPPSSHRRSRAPRTPPRSPTYSGTADSPRTTRRSTGGGSAAPGRGRLCSGPARSPTH